MKTRWVIVFALALSLAALPGLRAQQEHPEEKKEHPQEKKEHPEKEHPEKKEHPESKPVSMAAVEKSIKRHVEKKTQKHGGTFPVKDEQLGKTWQLELVKVHTDRLAHLENEVYFACVDFRAADGTLVDADFYLKQKDGKLKVTDTTVHKVNGQARFNYQKAGEEWKRVPVGD